MSTAKAVYTAQSVLGDEAIISADSHVMEPADLWINNLTPGLKEKYPKFPPRNSPGEKAGGWDPRARIEEMEVDGVSAEVLYPTLGLRLFALEDAELQEACFRIANDWLIDYCKAVPGRLVGIPMTVETITSGGVGLVLANFAVGGGELKGDPTTNAGWNTFVAGVQASPNHRWQILGFSDCEGDEARNTTLRADRATSLYLALPPDAQARVGDYGGAARVCVEAPHAVPRTALVGKAFFIYWPHAVPFLNDGRGYPIAYHYTGPGEKTDYPKMSIPFYPQFTRMHRIR